MTSIRDKVTRIAEHFGVPESRRADVVDDAIAEVRDAVENDLLSRDDAYRVVRKLKRWC